MKVKVKVKGEARGRREVFSSPFHFHSHFHIFAFLVFGLSSSSALAFEGYRPLDRVWVDKGELTIEWKDSWDTTLEANKTRWSKELERTTPDKGQRERLISLRLVRLLEALIERYPNDVERRRAAFEEAADRLAKAGCRGMGNYFLKRLVNESPGSPDVAAAALERILADTLSRRNETEEADEWIDYAVGHLLALHRAGHLANAHRAIELAWKTRLEEAMEGGRLAEASAALKELEGITGRTLKWQVQEAELLFMAGRHDEARQVLDELAAQGVDGRVAELIRLMAREQLATSLDFPRRSSLEMRWEAARAPGQVVDAAVLQSLLDEAAKSDSLVPTGRAAHTSLWSLIDRYVRSQSESESEGERQTEGRHPLSLSLSLSLSSSREARRRVAASRRERSPQAFFAVARQFPWSGDVHRELVSLGEEALRRGHAGIAFRCFRDALTRSADGALRAKAQVGLKLANSSRHPQTSLRVPPVAKLKTQMLLAPPASPWVPDWLHRGREDLRAVLPVPEPSLQTAGDRVVLAGPNLLACFAANRAEPLWWRSPHGAERASDEAGGSPSLIIPGPFLPAVDDGRVFTRWGLDPWGRLVTGLAAFDLATGDMLWSTRGDPAWEALSPVTDPAAADGRLYVLAVHGSMASIAPVWLVCLDAARGTVLWQRLLASHGLGLPRAQGAPSLSANEIDLVHYGNAPLVHQGAVYCVTNLGFVACCDARDGLVEWTHTHPRVRLGKNLSEAVRRQGASPMVFGDAVVFAPRDYTGVFAIEKESGRLLWDEPFVPSAEPVGLANGALVLRDGDDLAAVEAASGRVLWERRFEERLEGRALLVGSDILVRARARLYRIAAATGQTLDQADWASKEPIRGLALLGDSLVALTDGVGREEGPVAAASAGNRLPLTQTWELPRPDPTLWTPPPSAKVGERLYLESRGILACVATGPAPRVEWQRVLLAGSTDVVWGEKTLFLLCPGAVVALNALTGECLWETPVPIHPRGAAVCGEWLVVGSLSRGDREAGAIAINTGKLLWYRQFLEVFSRTNCPLETFAWDGQHVHLFATRFPPGKEGGADFLLRPADGQLTYCSPFPGAGLPWPSKIAFGDGAAFFVSRENALVECSLRDGSLRKYAADVGTLDPRKIERIEIEGTRRHVYWNRRAGRPEAGREHWILRRDDPSYLLRRKEWGTVQGDTLLEQAEGTWNFAAVDLPTGKEVAFRLPDVPEAGQLRSVLGFHDADGQLTIASTAWLGQRPGVRLDSFERPSGTHVETQVLPGVDGQEARMAWSGGALFVADHAGLHAFVPLAPGERKGRAVHVAYRSDRSAARDAHNAIRLADARAAGASLRVAHDEENLYLVARYRDAKATPWSCRTGPDCGDWLELSLKTSQGTFRWATGLDGRGRTRCEGLAQTPLPEGLDADIHYDPDAREFACEVAIPMKGLFAPSDDRRRIGLSAAAWDDAPASGGARRLFEWAAPRVGLGVLPISHETIYLDPRTREQGAATAAIIEQFPDLPASFDLFTRDCQMSASTAEEGGSSEPLAERYWEFIERHPRSVAAERLLSELIRMGGKSESESEGGRTEKTGGPLSSPFHSHSHFPLSSRAAHAGVPEAARKRLLLEATSYLSQRVFITEGKLPKSVLLEMNAGLGRDEWGHRAFWGDAISNWIIPPHRRGPREDIPQGKWHELRVPLAAIDMHDKPICGINFCQQGPPRIVWDRSAVVAGGKETVFLDDDLPKCVSRNEWQWVSEPRFSGTKAHTQPPPEQYHEVRSHTIVEFEAPIIGHLAPPLDRPYLSQWVWLDPANPPRTVMMGLHDGLGWRCRLLWGERTRDGRYMGPLPKPGEWRELCVPLAWTPFVSRPVAGIGFSHLGGRLVWDRTALVVDGKEHLLIDDDVPPTRLRALPMRGWRSWVDGHLGGTYPAPGKVGVGMLCDGRSGCVIVPHSPEIDPPQLTVEAWVYLENFAPGRDTKQWVVNKNLHAWANGYFGLLIYRDKIAADLNIGGEKENRVEAWSEPGILKLKTWHQLAMTYDGATLRAYRDGELVAHTEANKPRQPGSDPLLIGRWANGYGFLEGIVDEVRLYRRALTADEIRARHDSPGVLAPAVAQAVVLERTFDDEAAPPDPAAEWQWVTKPVHSGTRAHTDSQGRGREGESEGERGGTFPLTLTFTGFIGHAVGPLRDPIVQHLPLDRQRAVAFLKEQIPRLGTDDETWQLFDDLLQLELPDARKLVELNRWFLSTFPGHPRSIDVLGNLLNAYTAAGEEDPEAQVEALLREFRFPLAALYQYHRRYAQPRREFLSRWQILGPFAAEGPGWGIDTRYPPEADGVKLDAVYQGAAPAGAWTLRGAKLASSFASGLPQAAAIRWRPLDAEGDYVNLNTLLEPNDNVVAYAATWVHSDRNRDVSIAVGSDDHCKVWVNRRLVLAGSNKTYASAGEFLAPARLSAGWNELLVKVTEGIGEWGFYFELLDDLARRAPDGVRFSTTPPEENRQ